jgi:hypothetical protein
LSSFPTLRLVTTRVTGRRCNIPRACRLCYAVTGLDPWRLKVVSFTS